MLRGVLFLMHERWHTCRSAQQMQVGCLAKARQTLSWAQELMHIACSMQVIGSFATIKGALWCIIDTCSSVEHAQVGPFYFDKTNSACCLANLIHTPTNHMYKLHRFQALLHVNSACCSANLAYSTTNPGETCTNSRLCCTTTLHGARQT